QTCSVTNGSGVIGSANVTDVAVACVQTTTNYTIGGRVRGLTAPGLVLQFNGSATLTMNANGLYAFSPGLPSGVAYAVTVQTAPAGLTCTVSNGTGTVGNANVTNVDVDCQAANDDTI